ncbi:hypothetical protein C0J52_17894 [Blattella germanica]|nr:hypothetical protein C0J52_17894 [Blattella germanica]
MQQRWRMLQSSTCEEQRSIVRFLWVKGHKPSEIHWDMRGMYGDDCMDRSNVSRWCIFFQEGRVNLSDSPRSGRPTTAATPQNVRGIEVAILNDRRPWWCIFFQEGRVNLSDSPRSGRPTTAATPQNVRGIEVAILNDRRVQLRALSQKFNISYGALYDVVHENLKFRKVSARWVPNLTDDHKGQRMMASLDHLTR